MNKVLKTLLVLGLAVAVATPALAEFKVNGYFRTQGYSGQFKSVGDPDGDSQQWTTQRFRAKVTNTLNENVAVVWYGEVDTDWGLATKGGNGGKRGADATNVETKNVYLDLKFDDTSARVGIQTMLDTFDGIVFFDDMAGVQATQKFGDTAVTGIYSKWDEGSKSDWDAEDFYGVVVAQKFSDNFKGSFAIYNHSDNDFEVVATESDHVTSNTFFYGPRATFSADNLTIDGFLVFQDGEVEYDQFAKDAGEENYDVEGFLFSAKATMKIDGGDLNARFIYGSAADDDNDEGAWTGDAGAYAFVKENQMLMLIDPYVTDWAKEQYAVNDALKQGFGLMAFVVSGNHSLDDTTYVKWGAGYYLAVDEERYDTKDGKPGSTDFINSSADRRNGDTIGYEVSARVGKKFFDKVDISLNAAYAGFGDFYDNSSCTDYDDVNDVCNGTAKDPDDIYKAYLMVNVPF